MCVPYNTECDTSIVLCNIVLIFCLNFGSFARKRFWCVLFTGLPFSGPLYCLFWTVCLSLSFIIYSSELIEKTIANGYFFMWYVCCVGLSCGYIFFKIRILVSAVKILLFLFVLSQILLVHVSNPIQKSSIGILLTNKQPHHNTNKRS